MNEEEKLECIYPGQRNQLTKDAIKSPHQSLSFWLVSKKRYPLSKWQNLHCTQNAAGEIQRVLTADY